MDPRITALVAHISAEVDPQIGNLIVHYATDGLTYDEIMEKLRAAFDKATVLREADKA